MVDGHAHSFLHLKNDPSEVVVGARRWCQFGGVVCEAAWQQTLHAGECVG